MDLGISLTVVKDIKVRGKRVGDYFIDGMDLYYNLPYPFPCKFKVSDFKHITVTPFMLKLPYFLKYHNIDQLRQQLMQIKCVQKDCVLLHGAAWKKAGEGFLCVGFPNSGKTTKVLKEVVRGASFCSDENIVIDKNGMMFPVARQSSLYRELIKMAGLSLTLNQKIALVGAELRAKISPLFEPNIFLDLPYDRHSFKLDKIIYLTEGVKSLALLTDNEFPFYTNPVIQTFAYATGFDLDKVYAKYRGLLKVIQERGKDERDKV